MSALCCRGIQHIRPNTGATDDPGSEPVEGRVCVRRGELRRSTRCRSPSCLRTLSAGDSSRIINSRCALTAGTTATATSDLLRTVDSAIELSGLHTDTGVCRFQRGDFRALTECGGPLEDSQQNSAIFLVSYSLRLGQWRSKKLWRACFSDLSLTLQNSFAGKLRAEACHSSHHPQSDPAQFFKV